MLIECPHCGAKNPGEAEKCQFCGKRFDELVVKDSFVAEQNESSDTENEIIRAEAPAITPGYDFSNKNIFKIFKFSLQKALNKKLWQGIALWAGILIIPVGCFFFFSLWLEFTIADKVKVDSEAIFGLLKNIYAIKAEDISLALYIELIILILSISLIFALASGLYGCIFDAVKGTIIQPMKTFWNYLDRFYMRIVILNLVLLGASVIPPLLFVQIFGNTAIIKVLWISWNIALGIYLGFAPVALIVNDYSAAAAFKATSKFITGNLWRIMKFFLLMFAFLIFFQIIYATAWAAAMLNRGNLRLIFLAGIIIIIFGIYQWLVVWIAQVTFYVSHKEYFVTKPEEKKL